MADIEAHKKVCVIQNGKIIEMYWEHSKGNDAINKDDVIGVWQRIYGATDEQIVTAQWLADHGFANHNVIRDGHRPTAP